jgi:hypothetical protein
MKKTFYIFLLLVITSCGISEDCFKGNGNSVTQLFPLEGFTKVKVYDGVGLVIKEGLNYEVKIVTNDKIIDNIDVSMQGDMLVVKDNSTCNIARDYGQTMVYLTTPNLEEIHSKTEQDIKSDGVLHFPELRLYSIDLSDGAGTGDFYLNIDNLYVLVESNNISNFYISGNTRFLDILFTWGNGFFYGENMSITNLVYLFHRGSNDIILKTSSEIKGNLYSTGNLILKENPQEINVNQLFTGRIIHQY